ncbi:MAG: hypothetical protein HS128_05495 [Ideonella sp.]|nr:hypothetical protein [Ideonella sp.]MCC7459624.1 hypothetical protein [Nitrospira sp.]
MSGRPTHLRNLAVGQSVRHGRFGIGKVVATGRIEDRETATVDFGRSGLRVLDVAAARLLDPGASTQHPSWEDLVDETAALEPLGAEPWAAWFGPAVVDDAAAFRQALHRIEGDWRPYPVGRIGGHAQGWPEVDVLLHPAAARRVDMVLAGVIILMTAAGPRSLIGLPFYNDWDHEYVVTPRRIRVCRNRIEAVVAADLHLGAETFPITFALPTFDIGRPFLAPDRPVAVALTALAFECEPAPSPTLRVRHDPSVVAAVRAAGGDLGVDDDGLSSFSIAGMSAWLPDAGRGDLVDFRGQVAAVQTIALPPGQRPAWRLRLRAWRAADADGLLDVVFEASVWPMAEGPAVGSDVQGRAWLVGEVLGPA